MPDRAGQVLFSYADPQAPPDVLFPEEHLAFLAFVSDEQERPAMLGADWSVSEAASLLLLLRQLLASWRRFNLQLLHRRPRSDAARPLISFLANADAVRNVRTLPGRVGQRLTRSRYAPTVRGRCAGAARRRGARQYANGVGRAAAAAHTTAAVLLDGGARAELPLHQPLGPAAELPAADLPSRRRRVWQHAGAADGAVAVCRRLRAPPLRRGRPRIPTHGAHSHAAGSDSRVRAMHTTETLAG